MFFFLGWDPVDTLRSFLLVSRDRLQRCGVGVFRLNSSSAVWSGPHQSDPHAAAEFLLRVRPPRFCSRKPNPAARPLNLRPSGSDQTVNLNEQKPEASDRPTFTAAATCHYFRVTRSRTPVRWSGWAEHINKSNTHPALTPQVCCWPMGGGGGCQRWWRTKLNQLKEHAAENFCLTSVKTSAETSQSSPAVETTAVRSVWTHKY